MLIYNQETNIFKNGPSALTRANGEALIALRSEMAGKTLHVFYFFTSRDGKKLSSSYYAGSATLPELL